MYKLSDINNLNDPLKQFLVDFNIAIPQGGNPFNFDIKELTMRAQTFSFPQLNNDKTEVTWGGYEKHYYGKQTRRGDWTVTVTEVWSGDVIGGFKNWAKLAHNYVKGTISLKENYMTTAVANLFNPDLYDPKPAGAVAKKVKLFEFYPTNIQVAGDINPSSSEKIDIQITFNYNFFLIDEEIDEYQS